MPASKNAAKIPWRECNLMAIAVYVKGTRFSNISWPDFLPIFNETFKIELEKAGFPTGEIPKEQSDKVAAQWRESGRPKNADFDFWDHIKNMKDDEESRDYDRMYYLIKHAAIKKDLIADESSEDEGDSDLDDDEKEHMRKYGAKLEQDMVKTAKVSKNGTRVNWTMPNIGGSKKKVVRKTAGDGGRKQDGNVRAAASKDKQARKKESSERK